MIERAELKNSAQPSKPRNGLQFTDDEKPKKNESGICCG